MDPRFHESSWLSPTSKPLHLPVPPPVTLAHAPPTATSPSWTPRPGLRAREQASRTRGFSVWCSEGGEGPEDERLPQAGPSAPPPPSDSVDRAGPGAAGEEAKRGHSGHSSGLGAGYPGRRRRASDLPLCCGDRPSSRIFSVPSPRS